MGTTSCWASWGLSVRMHDLLSALTRTLLIMGHGERSTRPFWTTNRTCINCNSLGSQVWTDVQCCVVRNTAIKLRWERFHTFHSSITTHGFRVHPVLTIWWVLERRLAGLLCLPGIWRAWRVAPNSKARPKMSKARSVSNMDWVPPWCLM